MAIRSTRAFTLIELLVVVSIIALLIAILVPGLSAARIASRRLVCLTNLHQAGTGIHAYAHTNRGYIPFGPKAPPYTITNFYPSMGAVTSLISLESGEPVGMGLTLDKELARTKRVLFCPDADQGDRAQVELAKVGRGQAQSDYYYRHGSGSSLYKDAGPEHIQLSALGRNTQGLPIRALMLDENYLANPFLTIFNVYLRTNHRMETVNVLFSDNHAVTVNNRKAEYTIDARRNVRDSFALILAAFERADRIP